MNCAPVTSVEQHSYILYEYIWSDEGRVQVSSTDEFDKRLMPVW